MECSISKTTLFGHNERQSSSKLCSFCLDCVSLISLKRWELGHIMLSSTKRGLRSSFHFCASAKRTLYSPSRCLKEDHRALPLSTSLLWTIDDMSLALCPQVVSQGVSSVVLGRRFEVVSQVVSSGRARQTVSGSVLRCIF